MGLLQDLQSRISKSRSSLVNSIHNATKEKPRITVRPTQSTVPFDFRSKTLLPTQPTLGVQRDFAAGTRGKDILKPIKNFATEVAQSVPRAGGRVSLTVKDEPTFTPTTRLEKFLFGDRDITSVQKGTEEATKMLEEFGISSDIAKPTAFVGVVGGTLLDLFPPSAGKNKLVKEIGEEAIEKLVKEFGEEAVEKLIKGQGDEVIKAAARNFRKEATTTVGKFIDNINIKRLGLTDEGAKALDDATKQLKKIQPELEAARGKPISHEELLEQASRSDILKTSLSREDIVAREAAELRTRQQMTNLSNQVGEVKDPAEIARLTEELVESFKVNSSLSRSAGVKLQARRIAAADVPERVKIVNKMIKELDANADQIEEIVKASADVDFDNIDEVTKFFREFIEPTTREIIDEFRYVNLLSNPKTHNTNIFSNFLQAGIRPVDKLASGVVDSILTGLKPGRAREAYVKEVPEYIRGLVNSIPDATKDAVKVFKEGAVKRPELSRIPTGRLPIPKSTSDALKKAGVDEAALNKAMRAPLRALEAADVFFQKIIGAGEYESLIVRNLENGVEVIPDVLRKEANEIAKEGVFRRKLGSKAQGDVFQAIDTGAIKLKEYGEKHAFMRWFVPFVDTPTNILKQGIERTPGVGLASLKGASSAEKVKILGRQAVGSMIMASAGHLAMQGRTTWQAPRGTKARAEFFAEGKQEYAIKIGDKWVQYSRIGPIAYPIAMAAAMKSVWDEDLTKQGKGEPPKGAIANMGKSLMEMGQFFGDQSYLESVGNLIDLITEGDINKAERLIANIPSQLVPFNSFLGFITRIADDVYRKPESILENLQRGLPFISKGVGAFKDPQGEDAKRQFNILNQFSPFSITEEKDIPGQRPDAGSDRPTTSLPSRPTVDIGR